MFYWLQVIKNEVVAATRRWRTAHADTQPTTDDTRPPADVTINNNKRFYAMYC